ncbi:nitrate reductase molybdenum cofactor assembly chaperone [Virgibacillus xinjiangensis]|uniref:Nitrate reductase molybdenum cofactor assembly chaperone n=1 Tax=Virgibacillus xinjiangensis TaxID=393090 RepID=A0ABV7CVX6_9BACI
MDQDQRAVLLIASRLLGYPEETDVQEEEEMDAFVEEKISSLRLRQDLKAAYAPILRLPVHVRRELYVSSFDLKSKLGLYLTAHELGDSPKRGAALIRLQNILADAGYAGVEGELADYIPLLFEFLAITEENPDHQRLVRRLAVAIKRMSDHIHDSPFAKILEVLRDYVFPEPTKAEIEKLEFEREEADLEELPYPIMYQ